RGRRARARATHSEHATLERAPQGWRRVEMNDASFDEDMELDAEARALIEALRAEEELPADVHTRVWARIDEEIVERRGRSSGLWMVGGLAVAAALALVWIGGRTLRPDV